MWSSRHHFVTTELNFDTHWVERTITFFCNRESTTYIPTYWEANAHGLILVWPLKQMKKQNHHGTMSHRWPLSLHQQGRSRSNTQPTFVSPRAAIQSSTCSTPSRPGVTYCTISRGFDHIVEVVSEIAVRRIRSCWLWRGWYLLCWEPFLETGIPALMALVIVVRLIDTWRI